MMVGERQGWALVRYSNDHVGQEAKANAVRLAVHPAARPAAEVSLRVTDYPTAGWTGRELTDAFP